MLGYIILFIATIILSQAGNVIRFADAHPITVAFYRLLFAFVLLFPFSLPQLKKNLTALDKKTFIRLSLMGFFFALHFFLWIKSVQTTKVAHAAICFALNPVFVALGAIVFLKEKIHKGTLLGIALGFLGIVILGLGDFSLKNLSPNDLLGDSYAALGGLAFAIYLLLGKSLRTHIGSRFLMSYVYLSGAIFSLLLIFLEDLPLKGFSSTTWLAFGTLALFQTILGHASLIYSLKFFKASFVSTFLLLEPLLAGIVAFFLFGERVTTWALLGYILISSGIISLFYEELKGKKS